MNLNLLTWNVRGMGKSEKIKAVCRLISKHGIKIAFLQETKLEKWKPWMIRRVGNTRMKEAILAPSEGASGGLCVTWDPSFFKKIDSITRRRWISVTGFVLLSNTKIRLINVYASNNATERKLLFDEISECIAAEEIPTVIGGILIALNLQRKGLVATIVKQT
ncbi:hypothetical protein HRI_004463300 [Hibiscus trionum]|uniref:Endonuclease/exonuclease/phosphatase domain-containing protein n=1 Tax=Hibiscus trionum TaxID=183268 RepID=A0A9W7J3P0_HIBTR|nr:hypothetical protein HRI_004463300 [Hibiscus trionum]